MPRGYHSTGTSIGRSFGQVDPKTSATMSKIRSRGNKSTERRLRAALVRRGLRGWLLRPMGIVGNPDFLFPRQQVAIFVDGCFWHKCPDCYRRPKSRRGYWDWKAQRNVLRDQVVNRRLKADGFVVIRIWEHEIKGNLGNVYVRIARSVLRRSMPCRKKNQPQSKKRKCKPRS